MKNIYVVQNGTITRAFSKDVIDDMKMLNLITFRGTRATSAGRVYTYTASFDDRKPV